MVRRSQYRILVTGAAGQLGRELVRVLAVHGEIVPCIRARTTQNLFKTAMVADLATPGAIRNMIQDVRPHFVVNAAAFTAVDAAEQDRASAWAVNGTAPGLLAEELHRVGGALIHYSTDYVFNGTGCSPWREEDEPDPINVYGHSKLAGERAIAASGVPHVIVRTSWLYGACGTNFVATMLDLAKSRHEISVVDDQVGAPTSTRFLAEVSAYLISCGQNCASDLTSHFGGLLHVACAGEVSRYGLALEVFQQSSKMGFATVPTLRPVLSAAFPTVAARPRNSRLCLEKMRQRYLPSIPHWRTELRRVLPGLCQSWAARQKRSHTLTSSVQGHE